VGHALISGGADVHVGVRGARTHTGTVITVKRRFWAHQVVEYLFGLGAIAWGAQSPEPLYPCLAGALLLVNAATTHGPIAAFRLVPRRMHRVFDVVIVVLMLVAAVVARDGIDASGRGMLVAFAVAHAFVTWRTDFRIEPARDAAKAAPRPIDAEEFGKKAGRLSGTAYKMIRDRKRS